MCYVFCVLRVFCVFCGFFCFASILENNMVFPHAARRCSKKSQLKNTILVFFLLTEIKVDLFGSTTPNKRNGEGKQPPGLATWSAGIRRGRRGGCVGEAEQLDMPQLSQAVRAALQQHPSLAPPTLPEPRRPGYSK